LLPFKRFFILLTRSLCVNSKEFVHKHKKKRHTRNEGKRESMMGRSMIERMMQRSILPGEKE
jgi:hypothetical protein